MLRNDRTRKARAAREGERDDDRTVEGTAGRQGHGDGDPNKGGNGKL